jgi:hypothetical protein
MTLVYWRNKNLAVAGIRLLDPQLMDKSVKEWLWIVLRLLVANQLVQCLWANILFPRFGFELGQNSTETCGPRFCVSYESTSLAIDSLAKICYVLLGSITASSTSYFPCSESLHKFFYVILNCFSKTELLTVNVNNRNVYRMSLWVHHISPAHSGDLFFCLVSLRRQFQIRLWRDYWAFV